MKKEKEKISIKKILAFAAFIIVCLTAGFFLGMYMAERDIPFWYYFIVFAIVMLCWFLHVIIHEGGHLIGGRLSGYEFVSFRVYTLTFVRENGKLKRKKFTIAGTGGQCLMDPPEPVNGEYPFVLYNLGGSLMNLAVGCIAFALTPLTSGFAEASLFAFAVIGALFGFINAIPIPTTDGFNTLTLLRDKGSRRTFWLTLRTNALLFKGGRYRDMPEEWFELPDEGIDDNQLNISIYILRLNMFYDRFEFGKAEELVREILESKKMQEVHKNELRCELLFLEIIGRRRVEEIERLYTDKLKKYIKATASYVSRQRLLYAYAVLTSRDDTEAAKVRAQFDKAAATYPNAGEIESERELMAYIDRMAKA